MAQKIKKTTKKNRPRSPLRYEIWGILTLALGVLLFFGIFLKTVSGIFGNFVTSLLTGLLGGPYVILPFLVLFLGIFLIFSKQTDTIKKRIFHGKLLLLFISSIFHAAFMQRNPGIYDGPGFFQLLGTMFRQGQSLEGGGLLGGSISLPVIALFGGIGSYVVFSALALVSLIIITNQSIRHFLTNFKRIIVSFFRWIADRFRTSERQEKAGTRKELLVQQHIPPSRDRKPIDFRVDESTISPGREEKEIPSEKPSAFRKKNTEKTTREETVESDSIPVQPEERPSAESRVYRFPPLSLLELSPDTGSNRENPNETARKLEETLASFGVEARVVNYSRGPTVTRYELQPHSGVKVSRITSLADDISLNLASRDVRIEAPVPGKSVVGIEVPNREKSMVTLREVIASQEFKESESPLTISVGKDIGGKVVVADIKRMPHLLIAGATGSGKSVCISSLITSILYKASPEEVKFLLIDPKKVELAQFNGIPHLLIPVVNNVKKAAGALNWAVLEMTQRYDKFSAAGAKDLQSYNAKVQREGSIEKLPHIVIIIDELADLMVAAPGEVEDSIIRLAQLARAAGMYLIIATQRPSVNVITGLIKANIPSRIAFSVVSQVDSRTILDMGGAEKLLGEGDLLYHPIGLSKPVRLQGSFVTDREILRVVEFIKSSHKPLYDEEIIEKIGSGKEGESRSEEEVDEFLTKAVDAVLEAGQASVSYLQRKFKLGYARAARIVDQMEERGIVGPFEGSKPRSVLISREEWNELQMSDPGSFDYRAKKEKGE